VNDCGDTPEDCKCCGEQDCPCCGRFKGVCDKDGCDYNNFRLGDKSFFGKGPQFAVDSSKPFTVVTQFLTDDGTDSGDLIEIRRLYIQDGKVINNSAVKNVQGFTGDSITNKFCAAQKQAFHDQDGFVPKGGLKSMGEALGRGMVLVLSLWDDLAEHMLWLDSASPASRPVTQPGVMRGPCPPESGDPMALRSQHPDATVTYTNIKVGEIGTTYRVSTPVVNTTPAAVAAPTNVVSAVAAAVVPPATSDLTLIV